MKATQEEYDFHQRICARDDPIAFSEFATRFYHPLVHDVRQRAGGNADLTLLEEAIGQALLDYHDHPLRYDPDRKSLQGYLAMAAYRDYQNAQARENRIKGRQISLFDPALQARDMIGDSDVADILPGMDEIWSAVDEMFPDSTERQIVELIINQERSIEPYVAVLHIAHLPDDERHKRVQQVKYRITRRLRRNISRRLYPGEGELL